MFPSEQGSAGDFEGNGMVGAVADLIDAGRVKLYCVDSSDAVYLVELRRSARGAGPPARPVRALDPHQVLPWIYARLPRRPRGRHARLQPRGLSRGELRAAAGRPVPAGHLLLRQLRPGSLERLGRARRATYFNNPMTTSANLDGEHLDWLREPGHAAAGRRPGAWEDEPTGALPSTRAVRRAAGRQGYPARARPVGPRRAARLAVLARAARPASAAILLTPRGPAASMTDDRT